MYSIKQITHLTRTCIASADFKGQGREKPEYFTRNRKISLAQQSLLEARKKVTLKRLHDT